jgi:curved DNA-binding protein CbpA
VQQHEGHDIMNSDEDPYHVLGVSRDASSSEIRSAYRRLALQHHPDKQNSPEAKQEANATFASISHAYEILGDDNNRRNYDASLLQQQHPHYSFHDPFQVFAHVFGREFGMAPQQEFFPSQRGGRFGDDFVDPFFGDSMLFGMSRPSMFGRSMFGGSMFGGGDNDDDDMFSSMQRQMNNMMQQQQQFQQGGNSNGQYSYSSYSSSRSSRSPNGHGESMTTTTRMVNGKRQTITERTIVKPDGTVERHVETTGDDDFPSAQRMLDQEQQPRPQLPPPSNNETTAAPKRRWSRRKNSGRSGK